MFDPPLWGQHFAIQLISKNVQNLQNVHTYIPIDAEFYADFKNAYLYHYLEYLMSYSNFSVKIGHFTPRVTNLALKMQ